jgi:hypothetical protein
MIHRTFGDGQLEDHKRYCLQAQIDENNTAKTSVGVLVCFDNAEETAFILYPIGKFYDKTHFFYLTKNAHIRNLIIQTN